MKEPWRGWRSVAGLVFAYEAAALLTGKPVTLTSYSANRKWVKAGLMVLLGAHLFPPYLFAGARPELKADD